MVALKLLGKQFTKKVTVDSTYYTTEHRKGQHLSREERYEIQTRLIDKWSIYIIAKEYNTIKNEIKRESMSLYNGHVHRYKAEQREKMYQENRNKHGKQYRYIATARFLRYVVEHFKRDSKWLLDACYGTTMKSGKFRREEMIYTKALYNHVELKPLPIKNIDMPEKFLRKTKSEKIRQRKNLVGTSRNAPKS